MENVLRAATYVGKLFYYGGFTAGKMIARVLIGFKLGFSVVHVFFPWFYVGIDGYYCYMVGNLFSEELALSLKHTCVGVSIRDLLLSKETFVLLDTF